MNVIRTLTRSIGDSTFSWTVGKEMSIPNPEGGKLSIVISEIQEQVDREIKECYYLIYAKTQKGEVALWKKVHETTIVEYDVVSLLK